MFKCLAIQNAQQCANNHSAWQSIKFYKAQIKKINKQIQNTQVQNR